MKLTLLLLYLAVLATGWTLTLLNLRHLARHAGEVPPGFESRVPAAVLVRSAAYTVARSRVGLAESLLIGALTILFLFGGLLPLYDRWVTGVAESFIAEGVLFLLGLMLARAFIDLPFGYYSTFVIEERFGFNTTSLPLWLADRIKELLLSALFAGLLGAGALALVRFSPGLWWLWVWGLLMLFGLLLIYLSPRLIEPLFFRVEPLRDPGLEGRLRELAGRAGLRVSRVMQVDASRRSRHSNAYFSGIGRVKRIVLFDTLLTQLENREILAVVAHEIGHWKKGHVRRRLLVSAWVALVALFAAHRLLQWPALPALLGLEQASFAARGTLVLFLGSLAAFPLTPLAAVLSRRAERQADRLALELSRDPGALASALIKLSRDNLANLHPHPLYARFYYSHPPVPQRVAQLREDAAKQGFVDRKSQ